MKASKKTLKAKTVLITCILALLVFAGVFAGLSFADYNGASRNGETVTVTIEQGSSAKTIAKELKKAGAVDSELLFRVCSRISGKEAQYQYGVYQFKNNIGFEKIIDLLLTSGAKAETVTVVIPEGTCLYDYVKNVNGKDVTVPGIASLLENAGVCTKEDFFDALDQVELEGRLLLTVDTKNTYCALEGYLFPDTYDFFCYDSKECARFAIERMLARTEEIITDEMIENAESMGYTIHEMLTLASIVQLESGIDTDEMPNVSAVFHNRLNNPDDFGHLGSSPTIYYDKTMKGDGRYDTQNQAIGLPPGPICSAGAAAIKAAFLPTENFKYTYFVTDSDGKFYYNTSSAGHSSTIKKLQNEGKWIYELY